MPADAAFKLQMPLTRGQRAQKLVEEGQAQLARGNYFGAIETCTSALKLTANLATAYLCRAEARMLVREPEAAADALAAARLDPEYGDPYRILGIMDFEAGRYRPAIHHFDVALQYKPKTTPHSLPEMYYYRARSKYLTGDERGAIEDAKRGLAVMQGLNGNYGDPSFYSLLASIQRSIGEKADADKNELQVLNLLNDRLKHRGQDPDVLLRQAESFTHLNMPDKAVEVYKKILAKDQSNTSVLKEKAQVLFSEGKYAEAAKDLTRVLQISPEDTSAIQLRAVSYMKAERFEESARDYSRLIALEPDNARALAERAQAYRRAADAALPEDAPELYESALADFMEVEQLDARLARGHYGQRAWVHHRLGQEEQAMDYAGLALAIDSSDEDAHLARANAGVLLGSCSEARPSIDWLIQSGGAAESYWLRGECRCLAGEYQACLQDLDRAASLKPDSLLLAMRVSFHRSRYIEMFPGRATQGERERARQDKERVQFLRSRL